MGKIANPDRLHGNETMHIPEKKESNTPREFKKTFWKSILPQLFASLTVSFGSLTVGFASAYSSPALDSMSKEDSILQPNLEQKSWIGSLLPLFATLGGFMGGPLISGLGRKRTIFISGFPFIISFLLIALAQNMALVMVGRGLMGLCVGVTTLTFPIYLSETIEAKYRGVLGLFPTILGNSGVLISYTAGMFLNWENLAYLGSVLPIPFIMCAYLLPETPRWCISKGQLKASIKALQWLRGRDDVTHEFNEIETYYNNKAPKTGFKDLLSTKYVKPVLICLLLMFFQQLSGINAIIFYSVDIFKESGSNMDSNVQSIVLGAVNVFSTTAATLLIERLGRKILLYISSLTMAFTLTLLGLYFNARRNSGVTHTILNQFIGNDLNLENYGWIPLVCLVVYIIGFSMGFGAIPWLMMGEILPSSIKGTGASLVTAFNWACSFLVTKTFGTMTLKLGSDGTFWLYSASCILATVFIYLFVPETRGKSLEDIESMFCTDKSIEKDKISTTITNSLTNITSKRSSTGKSSFHTVTSKTSNASDQSKTISSNEASLNNLPNGQENVKCTNEENISNEQSCIVNYKTNKKNKEKNCTKNSDILLKKQNKKIKINKNQNQRETVDTRENININDIESEDKQQ